VLEEKKRTIEKELRELGVAEEGDEEIFELREKIKKAGMPKEVRKKAEYELERLASMPSIAPEASYIKTYLDILLDLPWKSEKQKKISIKTLEDFRSRSLCLKMLKREYWNI
jgi:ATP-dependent Lon protease